MGHSIEAIAQALGARAEGDVKLVLTGAAEPALAGPGDLALAMDARYADGLARGAACAAVLWDGADWRALGLRAAIFVPRPRYAMAGVTRLFDPGPDISPGIHPLADVHPGAEIGADAAIGPFTTIAQGVRIAQGARIASHVSIARGCQIGTQVLIHPGVRLGRNVRLGARVIVHPNAVIGADGFSFVTPEASAVEHARESLGAQGGQGAQSWTRIHSLGGVIIGDDVEVGANATIDQGTIRATQVGRGTKIDNLVQLGHNVQVGEDCLLCGQVGVAGSARIGNRVVLGGQCGVSDNIFVGDDVVAGGSTKIYTNAPAGRILLGSPAVKMETQIEINKALRRLPRMMQDFRALEKAVSKRDDNS